MERYYLALTILVCFAVGLVWAQAHYRAPNQTKWVNLYDNNINAPMPAYLQRSGGRVLAVDLIRISSLIYCGLLPLSRQNIFQEIT